MRPREDAVRESRRRRKDGPHEVDRRVELVQVAAKEGEPLAGEAGVGEADLDEVDERPLQRLFAGEDDRRGGCRLEDEERARPVVAVPPLERVEDCLLYTSDAADE